MTQKTAKIMQNIRLASNFKCQGHVHTGRNCKTDRNGNRESQGQVREKRKEGHWSVTGVERWVIRQSIVTGRKIGTR